MSANKEDKKGQQIKQLYAELNKYGTSEEFDKAVKSANKILAINPQEDKAIECKIVCLIQVSKFDEALKFLEKNQVKNAVFEKAYCEYRLNRPESSLKTIEGAGANSLTANLKELLAQVYYRLERFEECFDLYKDIIKNTHDDYEFERTTNLSAVIANLSIEGSKKEVPQLKEDTYELCYNSACALAGQNKFSEAERKLRTSEKLCREYLEKDGATDEDILDETAIIKVQLAYCLQMQGKSKEAAVIYADALKNKPSDPALIAVASNNSVVINKDQNMFDSKKKMRSAISSEVEHKLSSRQKKLIAYNNALLALFTNQTDVQQLCTRLAANYPDLEFKSTLIRISGLAKDKKMKDALEVAGKYKSSDKREVLAAKFTCVHLHLLNGDKQAAIEVLNSLGDSKYLPGVVSALVTLYLGISNKQAASEILKSAVDWYKKNKGSGGATDLTDMWRQAADFHLRGGEAETAAKSLEELLKNNPSDMKILAQLVIAYAQFNPGKAQEASKKLPALETLTTTAEIDNLEATNWMMIAKAVKKKSSTNKGDQSPGTPGSELSGQKQKKKRQRKRKGKLPKYCDPNAQPDPERWLPKYERTGYKKKRDRRQKTEVIKGSQGTSSGQADQFDMTKSYNQSKQSPATPAVTDSLPSGSGPRLQQRKHMHKKKKGKH